MKKVILLVLIGVGGWQYYVQESIPVITNADLKLLNTPSKLETFGVSIPVNNYSCDGRQHCSQMSSCEEATFFINNCPNTKMDGDYDGIPCESQHCN